MTINLPVDLEHSLRTAVQTGHFGSADDLVAEIVREYLQRSDVQEAVHGPLAGQGTVEVRKPIWEVIEEENSAIPPEVWDTLPTDLSAQHDHYIYGTPKRTDV